MGWWLDWCETSCTGYNKNIYELWVQNYSIIAVFGTFCRAPELIPITRTSWYILHILLCIWRKDDPTGSILMPLSLGCFNGIKIFWHNTDPPKRVEIWKTFKTDLNGTTKHTDVFSIELYHVFIKESSF